MADFTWDAEEQHYVDSDGRVVPRASVRGALDHVLDSASDDIEAASKRLRETAEDDDDALPIWFAAMALTLRRSNVAAGIIGAGGVARFGEAARAVVESRIAGQFGFLRDFARELNDGLPLDGAFVARSRMYGLSGTATFEEIARAGNTLAGYQEERRYLASARPCDPCIAYAARGWVPIGTLPNIGADCQCHSNCRCAFGYRMRK